MERISDEFKDMFEFLFQKKVKVSTAIIDIYKTIVELFIKCYEFTFSLKKKLAVEIAKIYDSLVLSIDNFKTNNFEEYKLLLYLRNLREMIVVIQNSQLAFIKDL